MLFSIGNIRECIRSIIRENVDRRSLNEEWWAEAYTHELLDDSSYKKDSMLVPNDIKEKIDTWAKSMGLSKQKR